jgi:metal-responsive CopG/Arc/MetJ family transcriptional regulator
MKAVEVLFTEREIDEIDDFISRGFCRSRADFVRKASIEFCVRHEVEESRR